jgi:hypothetical protein
VALVVPPVAVVVVPPPVVVVVVPPPVAVTPGAVRGCATDWRECGWGGWTGRSR